MLRVTFAQMRRSASRLIAAGIAIVISTVFVAITLLAGTVMTQTTHATLAARYAQADLVAMADNWSAFYLGQAQAIADVPGVESLAIRIQTGISLTYRGHSSFELMLPAATDASLSPLVITEGRAPHTAGEIALPQVSLDRLGAAVGSRISAADTRILTVTGVTQDPFGAFSSWGGAGLAVLEDVISWQLGLPHVPDLQAGDPTGFDSSILIDAALINTGGDVSDAMQASIATAITASDTTTWGSTASDSSASSMAINLLTPLEIAQSRMAATMGSENMAVLVFGMVFATVALLVTGLVIANTFQVLIAQRTRTLALLRCVGASSARLRRSVLLEGATLGLLGSLMGTALGIGLAHIALMVGRSMTQGVPLPSSLAITAPVLLVPAIMGTVVTLLACLAPAAAATRVSPVEALQPAGPPRVGTKAGRVRLGASLVLLTCGLVLMVTGLARAHQGDLELGILAALAGGVLAFVGVVLAGVFWLPALARLAGRLVGISGPTARLATANMLRNPRRTAATSTALVIGVTLVVTMATGAASAAATLHSMLDQRFAVDVAVTSPRQFTVAVTGDAQPGTFQPDDAPAGSNSPGNGILDGASPDSTSPSADIPASQDALTPDTRAIAHGAHAFAVVVDIRESFAWIQLADAAQVDPALAPRVESIATISGADAAAVMREAMGLDSLTAAQVGVPRNLASQLADGDMVTLTGPGGSVDVTVIVLEDLVDDSLWVLPQLHEQLFTDAPVARLWMRLDNIADATWAVPQLEDALAAAGQAVTIQGAAVDRAQMQSMINTALAVVIALLAAAVVIALIGVANTLSLSVIERRKESATLRAIGLSRGRLRSMLAIEGVLIASLGAVAGVVLGLAFGWLGASVIFAWEDTVIHAWPWGHIGAALGVAVAAGLLASVLPGRYAVAASPVEALAAD